jgi:hypothetical protein
MSCFATMLPSCRPGIPVRERQVIAVAGTNDLAEITQQRLIEISDEDAARKEDSVGDWG